MKIAGFQKSSFVDFPGIIACVVFTPGCNMNCSFCHNRHIISGNVPLVDELSVMDYLNKRKGMVKGVVISGGEPTLQPDLVDFIARVRGMGYKIKLDTNGTNCEVVKSLCEKGYIDYIAMDIKANTQKYSLVSGCRIDTDKILETVEYIKKSGIPHEFRTTFCPDLTMEDVVEISDSIVGDSDYYLQQYREVENCGQPHPREYLENTAKRITEKGGKCIIRGL
ncbi:MAG: anaerobic ribonucleoside-triphosphate reductase activating protein [Clostridia bacterium]|nr:anaerobic ribonucleoside-triphosphate reductase activating protein [Clostridia bacterium]